MNENTSVMKTIDMLIDQAQLNDLYMEYIALGPELMRRLSEEISVLIDPQNDKGLMINSLSLYREVSIREVAVESITVKYLMNKEEWIQLNT